MITVLYVGGCGRSGSTLLDRLLGALPNAVAVGELVHLPQRGIVEGEACGCGTPLHQCPFWVPVIERAFGAPPAQVDGTALRALQHRVDRNRFIPEMLTPGRFARYGNDLRRWADELGVLYSAIAAEAGAEVIVDSSKHASTAFLLRHVPGIDLKVVHLVRDARGMAYSWTKAMARPEATSEERAVMRRHRPSMSAGRWVAYNGLFEVLDTLTDVPVTRVIYEDLVREPRAGLDRILDGAGLDLDRSYPFLGDGWATLQPGHSVAGNPMRFSSGRLDLRVDSAWRTAMDDGDRRTVTAITAPLLAAYGYLGGHR